MNDKSITIGRLSIIIVWVLRIVLAALFLFAGAMKLTGQPMMIQEFDTVGFGQWFRYFTGALEVVGAVAVLIPSCSLLGAALVLLVDIGAFFAQALFLHMDVVHTIVIGLIICVLIYLQRPRPGAISRTSA
jgi:putative oxidoreductase